MSGTCINSRFKLEQAFRISKDLGIDKHIALILAGRGILEPGELRRHLYPDYSDLHSPYLLYHIDSAISRIRKAIADRERIGIFCDSDLDGLSSMAVLYRLLKRCGINPVCRYPENNDTYGLTEQIIHFFQENNIDLIITLDSGIRDVQEISLARSMGMDVMVVDHHEQGDVLPDAIIINPKQSQCTYPFPHLAGVGVIFKLCCAVLMSYLPVHDKTFIVLCQESDTVAYSMIRNAVIIDQGVVPSMNDITEFMKNLDHYDMVLFNGSSDFLSLLRDRIGADILGFCEFLTGCFGSTSKSLHNTIDECSKGLMEAFRRASGKIREFIDEVIGFVALGTIADVMPLVDENRTLVRLGLEQLQNGAVPLINAINGTTGPVTTKTISWNISPLLNTPGRFGKTGLTASLMLETDINKLGERLSAVRKLNTKRKNMLAEKIDGLINEIEQKSHFNDAIVAVLTDGIPVHFSGLLASRIADFTGKPAIVAIESEENCENGKTILTGSGRSPFDFDFFSHVHNFNRDFLRIGGHPQAFGFSLDPARFHELVENINSSVDGSDFKPAELEVDCMLNISELKPSFFTDLLLLEPTGNSNQPPYLLLSETRINSFQRFGSLNEHGKFIPRSSFAVPIIGWRMADIMESYSEKEIIQKMIVIPEIDSFRGKALPRLILQEIG